MPATTLRRLKRLIGSIEEVLGGVDPNMIAVQTEVVRAYARLRSEALDAIPEGLRAELTAAPSRPTPTTGVGRGCGATQSSPQLLLVNLRTLKGWLRSLTQKT